MYRKAIGSLILSTVLLSACAGTAATTTTGEASPTAAPVPAPQAASATTPAGPAVKAADTPLGKILVGPEGLTLYGFTNDVEANSTCYGKCADAWPPLIVNPDWEIGPELDVGIFATTTREDGQLQLVAGKWPLYYYAGDAAAGDVKGQGSGDVWFTVDVTGKLIKSAKTPGTTAKAATAPASATAVQTVDSKLGKILADDGGNTLYGFTKDSNGTPTCKDDCADSWPPLLVEDGKLPSGLDPAVFSVVARPDGGQQLKAGKWPLYHFAGDKAAGDTNGQGSGGIWFVLDAKGALIKDAKAGNSATPAPAAPTTAPPTTKASPYGY
jgi:predicted lipoprotein with Yx(FWY)xxD motif